jgi:glucose-1-phosphate thymidylyltransferase
VLAGGLGTRLLPMTRVTNKHLLPIYDRPMIYYPLQQLVGAGIREVMVVTGREHAGDFLELLGDGRDLGLERLEFACQDGEGGIAEALGLAQAFADGQPIVVILGDNVFQDALAGPIARFGADPTGAMVLLKEVDDPERFGVASVQGGRVDHIVEKPAHPDSPLAVTGCYLYDARVFDIIPELVRSDRGELEITDVNNRYAEWGALRHEILEGWWSDAGTVSSLHRVAHWVATDRGNPVLTGARS